MRPLQAKRTQPVALAHNIILLQYDNRILPLIHVYGEYFSNDIILYILNFFNTKIVLKKISNYSLVELQEEAKKNNIDILLNNKKKTKLQLYSDLSLLS